MFSCVLVVVSAKASLEALTWSILCQLAIWSSLLLWPLYLLLSDSLLQGVGLRNLTGAYTACTQSPVFWKLLLIVPIACLLPDICYKVGRATIVRQWTGSKKKEVDELGVTADDIEELGEERVRARLNDESNVSIVLCCL